MTAATQERKHSVWLFWFTRLRGYPLAAVSMGSSFLLTWLFIYKLHYPWPGLFFWYMFTMLVCSWCGYVPGVLGVLATVYLSPWLFRPGFKLSDASLSGLAILLLISFMVSRMAQIVSRAEALLRNANADLERRVRERTHELETLYSHLTIGACLLDRELRFVRVNHSLAEVNGLPVEEHIGKKLSEVVPHELYARLEPVYRRVLETGEPLREFEITGTDVASGSGVRTWLIDIVRLGPEDGRTASIQVLVQDVTERRRFEENLRQSAKLESLGVLAGGVAHDFNNLLTGMLGNASLAAEMLPEDHPVLPMLADVNIAAERAADLTRQLLAYSGRGRFVIETLDVSKLIRELNPLITRAVKKQAEIELDLQPDVLISADSSQIQQVAMNLIINAAEATLPGATGRVRVRTETRVLSLGQRPEGRVIGSDSLPPGRYAYFEVRDAGTGMTRETMDRIFDPFFSTKFTGRGLGLSAVLGIVRGHKGLLTLESEPGQGTTFRVYFPLSDAAAVAEARSELPRARGLGALVLVVDDEEVVRRTARSALEKFGYRVLTAEGGEEALRLFEQRSREFSVVVLDWTMPGMDGIETLRRLREIDPAAGIILSSGYDESDIAKRFGGHMPATFVRKPYTAAALVEAVGSTVLRASA